MIENELDLFNAPEKMKLYSLRKSKKILITVYQLWRRKRNRLLEAQTAEIQSDLQMLQEEVLKKNREGANALAQKCLRYSERVLQKTPFEQVRDYLLGIVYALFVVFVLIRPIWFELYEIPTGSMRPTFKEQDRLIVSKTDFGINLPFTTKQIYFDPKLAKRSGIIVFTVAGLDIPNPDTKYFWIFPGKKQYVKRLMGLPGDTLFFYGGRLYGMSKEGRDISEQFQLPSLRQIDHVPIIRFDGSATVLEPFRTQGGTGYRTTIVHQMNQPVAELRALGPNRFEGELLQVPEIHDANTPLPQNYWQLWGIGNYAQVMIKSKDEVRPFAIKHQLQLDQDLYLEMLHHPNLDNLTIAKDLFGRLRPHFVLSRSFIPLNEYHLKELFDALYTSRFVVKNGYATRYVAGMNYNLSGHHHFLTRLENVPDGTYEYYDGQAFRVLWGGLTKKLDHRHPLMCYSPDLVRKLFNFGIDFDKRSIFDRDQGTGRFAYFRNGSLYTMGSPILQKGDATLERFIAQEKARADGAHPQSPYVPFIDTGPPLDQAGQLDTDKIRKYGLQIPETMYLALGDNFASSGDSREFGFVPEGNVRGGPSLIFWPFGNRLGPPNQPPYPWFTFPNVVVWCIALLWLALWYRHYKKHNLLPLKDL